MGNSISSIDIGKNIRAMRENKGISRIDTAVALHYSTSNYCKIENGEIRLNCDALMNLCDFYECTPEQIIYNVNRVENIEIEDNFLNIPEENKRRILRMIYIACHCNEVVGSNAFHKMFGTNLLELITVDMQYIIPIVLEFERKFRDMSKKDMWEFLGITKNKYYELIKKKSTMRNLDIQSLIAINKKLGYGMNFLLFNRVELHDFFYSNQFYDEMKKNNLFEKQLALCVKSERLGEKIIEMSVEK